MWAKSGKKKAKLDDLSFHTEPLDICISEDISQNTTVQAAPNYSPPTLPLENKLKEPPKSISIREALRAKPETSSPPIAQADQTINSVETDETFDVENNGDDFQDEPPSLTQSDLIAAWQWFVDTELNQKPAYASLMQNYLPTLKPNYSIVINLENQFQLQLFNEVKKELTHFLRKRFSNNQIIIEEIVQGEESGKNKLYTVDDKFKHMSQKNPTLVKLKQQMNLDFI